MAAQQWPPQARAQLRLLSIEPDPLAVDGALRLSEFFETWFVPHVLLREGRSKKTVVSYRSSVNWWCDCTGDPPVDAIGTATLTDFQTGLRQGKYRRSPQAAERTLSASSVAKHSKQVRAVLYRLGPDVDPRRECVALLPKAPYITAKQPRLKPKAAFSLNDAKLIASAASLMAETEKLSAEHCARFWETLVVVLFYTGLRIGSVLALRRSMVTHREDGPWLELPAEIVKTGDYRERPLHPLAFAMLDSFQGWHAADAIFHWPHCYTHLSDQHRKLQRLAGIAKPLSPHAWRRTHAREIGFRAAALQAAQRALGHADERTTKESYFDDAFLVRQLPLIYDAKVSTLQRRLFD